MTETRDARVREAIERLKFDLDFSEEHLSEDETPDQHMADIRVVVEALEAIQPGSIEEMPEHTFGGARLMTDEEREMRDEALSALPKPEAERS